jgi:hypothetical protein
MFEVNYHWDRLKICVVGRAYPPEHFAWVSDPKIRSALERIMIETEEDFQKLIKLLESFGVTVIRPCVENSDRFKKPMVAPRDHMAMIGNHFYCDQKYNELELGPILSVIRQEGNPITLDQGINSAIANRMGAKLYFGRPEKRRLIANALPLHKIQSLDGVQMSKLIDLLDDDHMVDAELHRITALLKDHECHFLDGTEGHIDGTVSLIKPGLLLLANDDAELISTCRQHWPDWEMVIVKDNERQLWSRFSRLKIDNGGKWWMPGEEQNFALTDFVDTYLSEWVGYVAETFFEINTLMIDQTNAVCVNFTDPILNAYARHGVTPHEINFRHRFFWDGGIHCVTSDLHRQGR